MHCRMQNKFRDYTAWMDRLQEDMKRSNGDFRDDTRRIYLTARHSLQFKWVFAQAVNVGFVSDLSFLLLSEIVENTCYKDKNQNMKTVIIFQKKVSD